MISLAMLASVVAPAAGSGDVATVFAILAAAIVILGGLAALIRAIWHTANILRDNTLATQSLTRRIDDLLHRVENLERKL